MSGFSTDGHRRCVSCGGLYYNSHRTPICGNCREENRRKAAKIGRVKKFMRVVIFISFLCFYLGFLLYFLLKDKKPHFAKPILYASIAGVCFYMFVYFSQYFI
ncbi:hypothetical protein ABQG71_15825 [Bacillus altitudinis]|uniref:Uncharacterized protein n=1 Tax=Bacillus altitudinis TaxID=293387 RepID=A0ABV1S7Z7_BACAB